MKLIDLSLAARLRCQHRLLTCVTVTVAGLGAAAPAWASERDLSATYNGNAQSAWLTETFTGPVDMTSNGISPYTKHFQGTVNCPYPPPSPATTSTTADETPGGVPAYADTSSTSPDGTSGRIHLEGWMSDQGCTSSPGAVEWGVLDVSFTGPTTLPHVQNGEVSFSNWGTSQGSFCWRDWNVCTNLSGDPNARMYSETDAGVAAPAASRPAVGK